MYSDLIFAIKKTELPIQTKKYNFKTLCVLYKVLWIFVNVVLMLLFFGEIFSIFLPESFLFDYIGLCCCRVISFVYRFDFSLAMKM